MIAELSRAPCYRMWNDTFTSEESKAYTFCVYLGIGNPCYGQLTAVQNEHLLTSVTWLYHRLRYTTHWGDTFFKVVCWPVFGFQLIMGSGPFFRGGMGHFTVMNGSKAGVDLVLIQNFLLYYVNQVFLMLTSIFQGQFP